MPTDVILTIDDCPTQFTKTKIDYMVQHNIRAILFCRGDGMSTEKGMQAVVYAIRNSFIIGNHSFSHPRFSDPEKDDKTLEKLIPEERLIYLKKQINDTEKLIDEAYRQAGVDRPVKLFRFPYGDQAAKSYIYNLKRDIQTYLKTEGFTVPPQLAVTMKISKSTEAKSSEYRNGQMSIHWDFDMIEYKISSTDDKNEKYRSIDDIFPRFQKLIAEWCQEHPLIPPILLLHDFDESEDHNNHHKLFEPLMDAMRAMDFNFTGLNIELTEQNELSNRAITKRFNEILTPPHNSEASSSTILLETFGSLESTVSTIPEMIEEEKEDDDQELLNDSETTMTDALSKGDSEDETKRKRKLVDPDKVSRDSSTADRNEDQGQGRKKILKPGHKKRKSDDGEDVQNRNSHISNLCK